MIQPISPSPQTWLTRLPLRRIITSNRFIPEVDGFRFIAIFVVILAHIYGQCGPLPGHGAISRAIPYLVADGTRGVYLFFTISGFILALPFARQHLQAGSVVNLRSYFRRRITRLEPPYVLVMLLRFPLLFTFKYGAGTHLFSHLLASLFYVHSLVYGSASIINPPAWSLEVEIQFYLLTPLLTGFFLIRDKRLRRAVLIGSILVAGVTSILFIHPGSRVSLSLLNYLQYFLAGFLLCDLYLAGDRLSLPAWSWDAIGVTSLLWILVNRAVWFPAALPFAALALYLAGFHGYVVRAFFRFSPVSLIGGMCYSLYLTHSTVIAGMHPLVTWLKHSALPGNFLLLLILGLCCLATLFFGVIFFLLIERPCMNPSWPHELAVWMRRI